MLRRITVNEWIKHQSETLESVHDSVTQIIQDVSSRGDEALFELSKRYDNVTLEAIQVPEEAILNAHEQVDKEVFQALIDAYERIVKFHKLQKQRDLWLQETDPGILLGVKVTPLERIGIYVPGGRAAYSSTVLMCAAPAHVAGVSEICLCTPPGKDGPSPLTLAACAICGITEVYQVGGAQAIAAMAHGTESIARVDKIVGPGNSYVAVAKHIVQGDVAIDFPAGPSEIVIIADEFANPAFIAADILAQSEHDPSAPSLLITPSEELAARVNENIEQQVKNASRKEIILEALKKGGFIISPDLDEAVKIANTIAPEHLSLQVTEPIHKISQIKHAGSIFIGSYTPVACGDYGSGTNHVLPTGGNARLYSGLNVSHFTKTSTVQIINKEGLMQIQGIIEKIADAEGLHAHADSVRIRLESRANEDISKK
jgi:histidinol dehydrogenase